MELKWWIIESRGHLPFYACQFSVEREQRPLLFGCCQSKIFLPGAGWGLRGQKDEKLNLEDWKAGCCEMGNYDSELESWTKCKK